MNIIKVKSDPSLITSSKECTNFITSNLPKQKPMTPDEEVEAFIQYKNATDEAEKKILRDKILLANQRFVYSLAKKMSHNGDTISELVGEGNLGLNEAIDKFDVCRGFKFISYAKFYIQRNMRTYLYTTNRMVERHSDTLYASIISKEISDFYAEHMREPSDYELQEIMLEKHDINIKNLEDLQSISVTSTSEPVTDDMVFEDCDVFTNKTAVANDVEATIEEEDNRRKANDYLSVLDERSRNIVKLHFGIDCEETNDDTIALMYNMTPTRVKQIWKAAIDKMSKFTKCA